MAKISIQTDRLTRNFGSIKAVDGLSLEVPSGIIFGFLGPNGAGKTTTIRLLLGILEPTAGRAEVLGFDTRTQADNIRSYTGALLEHSGIYEQMSAEDNLEFYGRVWRLPYSKRQARIKELLIHMDLWERRKERAGDWSRGMKQKLALASALLHSPRLLLLDEPTAGLDVMAALAIRDDLVSLVAREGTTVFLTTHNMAEAEKLCQQVAVIRSGKLVTVGHPDELRTRVSTPQVEIIGRGFNDEVRRQLQTQPCVAAAEIRNGHLLINLRENTDTAPLIQLLVNEGVQVEEVRRGKASLEEVFVTLMEEEQ